MVSSRRATLEQGAGPRAGSRRPESLGLAALLAGAVGSWGTADAHTIHIVTGDDEATTLDLIDRLLLVAPPATSFTYTAEGVTPSTLDLLGTSVVLVATSAPFLDSDALGDRLLVHVQTGGRLVVGAHALESFGAPAGLLSAAQVVPLFGGGDAQPVSALDFASLDPLHPLFAGLTSVSYPDDGQGAPSLTPGATLLALDVGGAPIAASHCGRHVLALNLVPSLAFGGDLQLLSNALFVASDAVGSPSAFAGGAYTVAEGGTLSLDASASIELDDSAVTYGWDLDGDLDYDDLSGVGPVLDATVLDGPSTVTVGLRVQNPCLAAGTDSATVTITNVPPTLLSLTHNGPRPEGQAVAFVATASDPAGVADPLTFSWDFGDGTTGTGASVAHVYGEQGIYVVGLTVADDDGGSTTGGSSVTVTNVPPTVSLGHDAPRGEVEVVTFVATASDPAGAADPLTYAWDFGDGATASGASATHAYADNGVYSVGLLVSDDDGGSSSVTASVVVTNRIPAIAAFVGSGSGPLGSTMTFSAVATDPAGPADPLALSFLWGDGTPAEVGGVTVRTHAYTTPGTYTVTLGVDDGDGGSASRTLGVLVTNPGPGLGLLAASPSPVEAGPVSVSVTASAPLGGPVSIGYAWGDGTSADVGAGLLTATHTYADDGAPVVTVTATDAFGATATLLVPLVVANLPPTIVNAPSLLALEGSAYSFTAAASDPAGPPDPLAFALVVGPPGAGLNPITGLLLWTPSYAEAEAGPIPFSVAVDDGDGGLDTLSFSLDPAWIDGDADGLPDTWEATFGLDPGSDDSALDADGDGWTNLAEYLAGRDPEASNAPSAPTPVAPSPGAVVTTATPGLRVLDPVDPDGDTVQLDFEVYGDAQLTLLLDGATVPTGGGGVPGETLWTVTVPLPEDQLAYWRARGGDGIGYGPWSVLRSLRVDALNAAPSVPSPLSPLDATVGTLLPAFVLSAVLDLEDDPVQVVVRVRDAAGTLVEAIDAGALPDGSWLGAGSIPLEDDVAYTFTGQSTDDRGGSLGESAAGAFVVDVTNTAPAPPTFLTPAEGASVASRPAVVLQAGADSDRGAGSQRFLRVDFDVQADFASSARQTLFLTAQDEPVTVQAPLPFAENGTVFVRGRTEDERGGASAFVPRSFFVDVLPEAPGLTRVVAPGDGEVVNGEGVELRWVAALDPEGEPLRYALEVRAQGEETLALLALEDLAIPPGELEGLWDSGLTLAPGAYLVRARARDPGDLWGPYGPENRFVVLPQAGEPLDLGPGEGTGCACGASVAGAPRATLGLIALLLTGCWRRRGRPVGLRTARRRPPTPGR